MPARSRQTRLPGLDPETPAEKADVSNRAANATSIDPLPETLASSVADVAALTAIEPVAENGASPQKETSPPKSLRGKTVYVVDSHSLIFQVFHALPEMTSPRGEPVGAVFGFARDIMFLLEQKKPDYLFCAFDMHGPTFRHEMFAGYKEHRTEMPADLVPQIPAIERMLAALDVPVLGVPGYEADDVLATVARITAERGGECIVVTGDKDCRQLLGERVKMFNVRKNQMFDAAALAEDWGVRPEQVVDYQALVGDPVDNIPGVPLIGPKMARELLQKFGTLEDLYARIDEVAGGKRRDNLLLGREQAFLSR
ncbi:MAG TPA: 5'-3' exonuclease H3TH domain-containing protein, partial [Pirellulales bacterium]|nr:5'-3' exonuclease H3TH domain-containing protein [Pirellulales bacterium]